jgi:hypothetical protein
MVGKAHDHQTYYVHASVGQLLRIEPVINLGHSNKWMPRGS